MGQGSFYEELIGSDWMGRSSDEYTYAKKGNAIGWEETLTQGSAFSTFILNVSSKQKHLDPHRQLFLAKRVCTDVMNRMLAGTGKKTQITFSNDFTNYAQGNKICVSLEPLKPDNEIKFPTFNHALDPILGATAHEMGHILYTDRDYDLYVAKFKGVERELKSSIMNILEDERIEKLIAENFRGYTNYIGKIKDYCFGKKFPRELEKNGGAEDKEPVGRLYEVFIHLIRYPKALRESHVNEFEKEIRQFQKILEKYPTSIYELTVATEAIYKVFLNYFKQDKQPQKQPQPQPKAEEKPEPQEKPEESEKEQENDSEDAGEETPQPDDQQQEAKADSGDGNIDSDKGDSGEESEEAKDGNSVDMDTDLEGNEEKEDGSGGGKNDSEDLGDLEDDTEPSEESSDGGSDTGEQEENDGENSEGSTGGGSGGNEPTDTEEEQSGSQESTSNESEQEDTEESDDAGSSPYDTMTEAELAQAMAEALATIIEAIAEAQPELGTAQEVADMIFGGKQGGKQALRDISNFDNTDIAIRESAGLKFPELSDLALAEMNVVFLDPSKSTSVTNHYDDSLNEVRGSASSLRAKLQELNRNTEITNTGLFEGSFDDGLLVDAIIGAKNVFYESHKIQNRGATIILGIDESGSMSGINWQRAQQIAVMFERALDGVNNIDFYCYGHTTIQDPKGGDDCSTAINCYYEGRKKGDRRTLGKIYHHNTNRDGHAIVEMVARTRNQCQKDSPIIMFLISDGEPSATVPKGYSKKAYTKKCVDTVEQKMNATVIHIAIESGIDSKSMFNHYVKFTDHRTLVRDVGNLLKTIIVDKQAPITI